MPAAAIPTPLPRTFYDRDPVEVARALLGCLLTRTTPDGLTSGRIVEVEAYLSRDDPASHAFRGRTRRNASMFGPPGHAYVYTIHTRWCLNVVTEPVGVPSAVLVRAVEPLDGIDLMKSRRHTDKLRDLTRGPARLCEALAIDRKLDGHDLARAEDLWIAEPPDLRLAPARIVSAPRVGLTSARNLPLRFFVADNPFVSRVTRRRSSPQTAQRRGR